MKQLIVLAALFAAVTAHAAEPRDLWLSGRWKKADRVLEQRLAAAKKSGDLHAETRWTVERAYYLLDRNAYHRADPAGARAGVDAAQAIAERSGDRKAVADALHAHMRWLYWEKLEGRGEWAPIEAAAGEVFRLREQLGDRAGLADSYFYRGLLHQFQERNEPAKESFAKSLELAQTPLAKSYAHRHLGYIAQVQGDLAAARRHYETSLARREEAGAHILTAFALNALADFESETTKDTARPEKLWREALRVARCSGSTFAAEAATEALAKLRGTP